MKWALQDYGRGRLTLTEAPVLPAWVHAGDIGPNEDHPPGPHLGGPPDPARYTLRVDFLLQHYNVLEEARMAIRRYVTNVPPGAEEPGYLLDYVGPSPDGSESDIFEHSAPYCIFT